MKTEESKGTNFEIENAYIQNPSYFSILCCGLFGKFQSSKFKLLDWIHLSFCCFICKYENGISILKKDYETRLSFLLFGIILPLITFVSTGFLLGFNIIIDTSLKFLPSFFIIYLSFIVSCTSFGVSLLTMTTKNRLLHLKETLNEEERKRTKRWYPLIYICGLFLQILNSFLLFFSIFVSFMLHIKWNN